MLVLHEDPLARPAGRSAGLYHYALLYPSREELARAAVRLSVTSTPIDGASDHRTHEAIYLPDPDGNGIELAADRPREQWPVDLGYAGGPAALDFNALLATIAGEAPRAARRPRPAHGPPAPARRRHRRGPALLPRRARLRGPGQPRHGRLRVRRRLPPSPRLQHLARPRRRRRRPRTPSACATGRCSCRPRSSPRCAPASTDAEDIDGGFLVRDPWGTAVAFVA